MQLLVGSYSEGKPDGIRLVDFDPAAGRFGATAVLEGAPDASFFAYDRVNHRLYVTDEPAAKFGAFALSHDAGHLSALGYEPSGADFPCHTSLSPDATHVAVANYGAGVVSVFALDSGGGLRAGPQRLVGTQPVETGHAHWVQWSPEGDRLYAVDLGHDEVRFWPYDHASGRLGAPQTAFAMAKGSGPRHLAFHPNRRFAYLFTEYGNTITALERQPDGTLRELHTLSTLPADFTEKSFGAHIQINAPGTVVYVSNRGHNSIASFSIGVDGRLTPLQTVECGGDWPRFFLLLNSHLLVAHQNSNTIAVFDVAADGTLTATGETLDVPKPVMILAL